MPSLAPRARLNYAVLAAMPLTALQAKMVRAKQAQLAKTAAVDELEGALQALVGLARAPAHRRGPDTIAVRRRRIRTGRLLSSAPAVVDTAELAH